MGFIVVALIFFYAGDKYASGKAGTQTAQNASGYAARTGSGQRARGGGGVFGKIIAMDATSITVQLNAPVGANATGATSTATGSTIVFYTGQTSVLKTTAGSSSDLAVGTQVTVQGTSNPDGSVSAQTISIRPTQPVPNQAPTN